MRLLLFLLITSCSISCHVLLTSTFDETEKTNLRYRFKVTNCSSENTTSLPELLKQRIDNYKVSVKVKNINVVEGGVEIDVTSINDKDEFVDLLTNKSEIGIWDAYRNTDEEIKPILNTFKENSLLLQKIKFYDSYTPLTSVFAVVAEEDKEIVMETITSISASHDLNIKWLWGKSAGLIVDETYELYAIKNTPTGKPVINEEGFFRVNARLDMTGSPELGIYMDQRTAKVWAGMTTRAVRNSNAPVAFTVNDFVVSVPSVKGPITGGSAIIMGYFTLEEYESLAERINSSKLPCDLEFVSETEFK